MTDHRPAWPWPSHYFTTWVLVALAVPGADRVLDLPCLVSIVLFLSAHLTFVHPRAYRLSNDIVLTGASRFAVDVAFHLLPFLYVMFATDLPSRPATLEQVAGTGLFIGAYLCAVGGREGVRRLYLI